MKKIKNLALTFFALGITQLSAQSDYTLAAGLGLDTGSGFTFVGPSAKYFISEESAIQAEIMFETGATMVTGLYQYHSAFPNTDGLSWFAGGGASILFGLGESAIAIRPTAGLDYKLNNTPLAFSFDWRPYIFLEEGLGSEIGSFGIGVRYVFE